MEDRRVAMPPVDAVRAGNLLDRLKLRPLLDGHRKRPAADLDKLADAVARFSVLAASLGDLIEELDVNPLIAGPDGAMAVDALVIPKRQPERQGTKMEAFDTAEDRAFRKEVRDFFEAKLSDDIRRAMLTGLGIDRKSHDEWHRVLLAKGWAAPNWPKEHGGTGWSLKQQYIFDQERSAAWAPTPLIFNIDMVGPMFIRYGTEAQKARYLPRVLDGRDHWCQGFSEPGSGSDLASLKCRAVRKGDRYVINGAKLWQTVVYDADMMFGLFRTNSSGRKQQGISVFVLPMSSKGLSLREVVLLDGIERVAQCTFEDVEMPAENLIGQEGEGWSIAKYLLTLERLGIAEVAPSRACLKRLKALAMAEVRGNEPLGRGASLLADIAAVEADLDALEATEYRFLFDPQSNGELGPEVLDPEDQRHARPPAPDRAHHAGRGALRAEAWAVSCRALPPTIRCAALPPGRPGSISTSARSRSTAARTKSSAASSPRPCLACEDMNMQRSYFLGDDERLFRDSLGKLFADGWSDAERRKHAASDPGYSREVWTKLAEMGALGAFLPEGAGGTGGSGLELMVAMEAFGRACFASPYPWTVAARRPAPVRCG